jgi:hypothetical protein
MLSGELYTVRDRRVDSCEALFNKITVFEGYFGKHGSVTTVQGQPVFGYICREQ